MTTETISTSQIDHIHTYFITDNMPMSNIIHTSHIPLTSYGPSFPSIEDLSCNSINVKAVCRGSLQIATIPNGADIYIYEESQMDYVLRNVKTGTMIDPSIITDIECTSSTRSNKFKVTFPGYVDIEGMLDITDGTIYQLYIIMERCAINEPETAGGLLFSALAIGGLFFLLFGSRDKKHKKTIYYEKIKRYTNNDIK